MQRERHREVVVGLRDLIKVYSDGTVERGEEPVFPTIAASSSSSLEPSAGLLYRDVVIDQKTDVWVRLYVPPEESQRRRRGGKRMPVVVYYHWGGFVFFSARTPAFHGFCSNVAETLGVMVVSVNYRLAPEHRLPAAYEDSLKAVEWLWECRNEDPWLYSFADIANVFLMGESAGGNIAFQTAASVAARPMARRAGLCVRGAVLVDPNFTGEQRTASEKGKEWVGYTLELSDSLWKMALPVGANRDHPFANPRLDATTEILPLLVMVSGSYVHGERILELFGRLKEWGKSVDILVLEEEDVHGFAVLKMSSSSSASVALRSACRFIDSLLHNPDVNVYD